MILKSTTTYKATILFRTCASKFQLVLIFDLGWDSLESRRTAFYNVVNNKIAINLPEDLKQPKRSTRNHHSQSFIQLSTGPNYYNNSFFPRTVREWNSLNDQIVLAPSSNAFKCKLLELLRSN